MELEVISYHAYPQQIAMKPTIEKENLSTKKYIGKRNISDGNLIEI